jgi:hypothetical protein
MKFKFCQVIGETLFILNEHEINLNPFDKFFT